MARGVRGTSWRRILAAAACLTALACPVSGATTESREFEILVNGRAAGSSRITIVQEDNGDTYVSASGNVKFRQALVTYTWTIEAQEWWKNGQLVALKSDSTENKTRNVVQISSGADGQLQIRVNDKMRGLSKDVWTNSFWKLADARFHNKQVPVLEVDTGKDYPSQLQLIGAEQLQVNGKLEKCYHFRVVGTPAPTDVWFDEHHRLVRQEFTEAGQRTIVQLVGKN
jgi:hypothetical protein